MPDSHSLFSLGKKEQNVIQVARHCGNDKLNWPSLPHTPADTSVSSCHH